MFRVIRIKYGMHSCGSNKIGCVQNEKSKKLIVFIENNYFEANFCPFCGYQPGDQLTDLIDPMT